MSLIRARLFAVTLVVVLLVSFLLQLRHLGHANLKGLDESFHAIVARNLLKHSFTPTLIDPPYLPAETGDWQNAHIWLHKPILPLWQIAASYAVLGVNTFALRLPSAIQSTLAVWLTYLIGKRLFGRWCGLTAATLQAFCPAIWMLVHGYAFSDHIDIALLFWVELAVWLLIKHTAAPTLSGLALGAAFLCKAYPSLIVLVLTMVAWRLRRLSGQGLLYFLAGALLVAGPWTLYTAIHWPDEFFAEHGLMLRHLGSNVEQWAASWDRLVFDYALRIGHVFYPLILAALVWSIVIAWQRRAFRYWLLPAWLLGVLIPFALATSKTPASAMIAAPAMFLLVGAVVARAMHGGRVALGIWLGTTAVWFIWPGKIPSQGWGYPDFFGGVMWQYKWVLIHVAGGLLLGYAMDKMMGGRGSRRAGISRLMRLGGSLALPLTLIMSIVLFGRMAHVAWQVTQLNVNEPNFHMLGTWAKANLPVNAALLVDEQFKLERNQLMFDADRPAFAAGDMHFWPILAERIAASGGRPYLVTPRELPLSPALSRPLDGRWVYRLR